jgi:hypothetical protein
MAIKKFHFNFFHDFMGHKKDDEEEGLHVRKGMTKKVYYRPSHVKKPKKAYYGGGGMKLHNFKRREYQERKQLCTLVAKYRRSKELNAKHLEYISREETGRDGADPELYGADPEGYESRMAKLHFRFIISPGNQNVDLTELTEEFIKKTELRLGLKLDWVAANHYNTGKQHTHVLINGFDLRRKIVRFKLEDMKHLLRETLLRGSRCSNYICRLSFSLTCYTFLPGSLSGLLYKSRI